MHLGTWSPAKPALMIPEPYEHTDGRECQMKNFLLGGDDSCGVEK